MKLQHFQNDEANMFQHLVKSSPSELMMIPGEYLDIVHGKGRKTLLKTPENEQRRIALRSYGEKISLYYQFTSFRAMPCGFTLLDVDSDGCLRSEVPVGKWTHAVFNLDVNLDFGKRAETIATKQLPVVSAINVKDRVVQTLLRIDATSFSEWRNIAESHWDAFEELGASRIQQHYEDMVALPGIRPYQNLIYFNENLGLKDEDSPICAAASCDLKKTTEDRRKSHTKPQRHSGTQQTQK